MIKINLGKTRIESIGVVDTGSSSSANLGESRDILVKILVLVLGVVALKYYENTNLEELGQRAAAVSSNFFTTQSELEKKNQELASLGSVEQDSKTLQDKMRLLKKLSRLRLREVKALDYIQSIIPQRVWLVSLDIQKEIISIRGNGRDEADVGLFIKRLETGGYFSDVVLIKDSSVVEGGVSLRNFEISARTEAIN